MLIDASRAVRDKLRDTHDVIGLKLRKHSSRLCLLIYSMYVRSIRRSHLPNTSSPRPSMNDYSRYASHLKMAQSGSNQRLIPKKPTLLDS